QYDECLVQKEEFKACLSSSHPLAKNNKIQIQDLKNENFIMLSKSSLLYQPVINLCEEAGFKPHVSFVSDRISSIIQMVKNKQGIAILMHPSTRNDNVVFKKIPIILLPSMTFGHF
ncbi:LysR family transcriptional regulator substrate-binding protein, partial [Lactobacillus helveticus]